MSKLLDKDIDFIYDDLEKKGLKKEILLDEMVDHICCMIEPELIKGSTFKNAYSKLLNSLADNTFKYIQHQTDLSTNLKFQKMKKLMFVFGVIGTIMLFIGIFFKMNHLPGAAIGILTAVLFIVFGFLPLFFYTAHKEQLGNKNVFMGVVAYLTISLLIIGPLFKIMHWPGAGMLLFFGPLVLAAVFLPGYLIQVYKKAHETKTNFIYVLIIVGIGISSMMMLAGTRPSQEFIQNYDSVYHNYQDAYKLFDSKNDKMFTELTVNDSSKTSSDMVKKIKNDLNKILELTSELKKQLIIEADGEFFSDYEVKNKHKERAFEDALRLNDNNSKIYFLINDYKNYLISLTNNELEKSELLNYFDLILTRDVIACHRYHNICAIEGLAIITETEKNISLATYKVLNKEYDIL